MLLYYNCMLDFCLLCCLAVCRNDLVLSGQRNKLTFCLLSTVIVKIKREIFRVTCTFINTHHMSTTAIVIFTYIENSLFASATGDRLNEILHNRIAINKSLN